MTIVKLCWMVIFPPVSLAVSYNKSEEYVYSLIDLPVRKIKRLFIVLRKIEVEASI